MTLLCTLCARADSVTLRGEVGVRTGAPVTLADAAVLEGDDVARAGSEVVLTAEQAARAGAVVDAARVREVLRGVKGLNLGRVTVSGAPAKVAVVREEPPRVEAKADDAVRTGATLRDSVRGAVAAFVQASLERVRCEFDARDAAVLDTDVGGRVCSITPTASGEKVPVVVRVYDGDKLVVNETVRVGVLVLVRAPVAARALAKGESIGAEAISWEDRWLSPGVVPAGEDVVGAVTRSAVALGAVIEARQAQQPIVVHRGELVSVDCVSGTFVVRTTMRAKQDARVGEMVLLEPLAGQAKKATTKKSAPAGTDAQQDDNRAAKTAVRARVSGPGHAVLVEGAEQAGGTAVATE